MSLLCNWFYITYTTRATKVQMYKNMTFILNSFQGQKAESIVVEFS